MPDYKAPLRDLDFVTNELWNYDQHYQSLKGTEEVDAELRGAILGEAAKFAEQVIAPLRRVGDEEGCKWSEQGVTTPTGFKEAYKQYIEGGWTGLAVPEEFGGQALPASMAFMVSELMGEANHAWTMYPGLSAGCRETLMEHGTAEQQQNYLPKLVSGEWSGTMCLTESQCGSDLSFLRTKAEPSSDGSYSVTGTKIFISSGEHDMTSNILHVVLARVPGAPVGNKGISLFLVPKFIPNEQGDAGERNAVSCGSLEHKMGIHGNATCVMNFDGAKGYLIGKENEGLMCMFTFMNSARLGTAAQGLNHAEVALQGALSYSVEREAGRSLTGVKYPDRPADKLIVHPDVRKMILTIRAFSEGHRAFFYLLAQQADITQRGNDQQKQDAEEMMALLTPIAKGFMTETGLEAANLGVQVYGGHGFIREWGMEQNVRDARISTLYEGTTGIQSLDLLGRKVMRDGGAMFGRFVKKVAADTLTMDPAYASPLQKKLKEWSELAAGIGMKGMSNPEEVGAASVDFLMYSGYMVNAWVWGLMGTMAKAKLAESDDVFYRAKVATADFYFARIMPRTEAHKVSIEAGAESLLGLSDADFEALAAL
ncbi:MAG: alkylation response protein AidB-like acyl-CoA dehydrogenase [Cryomorphaceae bacterium]|jgi:alkylation response protein AidB-like acyl-CoA dehydrogenase